MVDLSVGAMQTSMVVEALGGERVFHAPLESIDLKNEIERGFPVGAYRALVDCLDLSPEEQTLLLRISPQKRGRWKHRHRIDPDSSDKLARIARVYALALHVLEDPSNASAWLREPIPSLDGLSPLRAAATDPGCEKVTNTLYQMDYGVYA